MITFHKKKGLKSTKPFAKIKRDGFEHGHNR